MSMNRRNFLQAFLGMLAGLVPFVGWARPKQAEWPIFIDPYLTDREDWYLDEPPDEVILSEAVSRTDPWEDWRVVYGTDSSDRTLNE